MAITYTPISDGTTADVADINTPFTTAYNQINTNTTNIATNTAAVADLTVGRTALKVNLKVANNSGDAAHDIDVDADALTLQDTTTAAWDTVLSSVDVTIASDAANGANALDTGAVAADTWYAVYVIYNGATTAGLFSLSGTAPTMPTGYTKKRRVGWALTDGSAEWYSFTHATGDNWFYFTDATVGAIGTIDASSATVTTSVTNSYAPDGTELAFVRAYAANVTNNAGPSDLDMDINSIWGFGTLYVVTTSQQSYWSSSSLANLSGTKTFSVTKRSHDSSYAANWSGTITIYGSGWFDNA